jgi:hypothetical protein
MDNSKDIKDYLHLYLGCDVARFDSEGVRYKNAVNGAWLIEAFEKGGRNFYTYKPILRPISDMQDDELKAIAKISDIDFKERSFDHACALANVKTHGLNAIKFNENLNPIEVFEISRFLLSCGFDLFGLIESGIALDKTKLNTNE